MASLTESILAPGLVELTKTHLFIFKRERFSVHSTQQCNVELELSFSRLYRDELSKQPMNGFQSDILSCVENKENSLIFGFICYAAKSLYNDFSKNETCFFIILSAGIFNKKRIIHSSLMAPKAQRSKVQNIEKAQEIPRTIEELI